MKPVALGLLMGLVFGAASAQQVWRCEQDGLVRYTDQPCEKGGRPLPARDLKTNVADGLATEAARAASAPASAASATAEPPEAAASVAAAASEAMAQAPEATVQALPVTEQRPQRARRVYGVALMGLMNTDFVQRGYVPRRQNPASTTHP